MRSRVTVKGALDAVPTRAVVTTFERVIATAGTTATPPEPPPVASAPIRASAVAVVVALASRIRSRTPVIDTPSETRAVTTSSSRMRANETPMPTLPDELDPAPTGSAFAVAATFDAAVMVTSPPVPTTVPSIAASVSWSTMTRATEPATETPPDAPEEASAVMVAVSSVPFTATVAETTRSCAVTVSVAGTVARFTCFARLMATPAPMPAVPPSVADPSAPLATSALRAEARRTVVPATIAVTAGVMIVSARTVERAMPTAAATEIEPPEVSAAGVSDEPEPAMPRGAATLSAWSR